MPVRPAAVERDTSKEKQIKSLGKIISDLSKKNVSKHYPLSNFDQKTCEDPIKNEVKKGKEFQKLYKQKKKVWMNLIKDTMIIKSGDQSY